MSVADNPLVSRALVPRRLLLVDAVDGAVQGVEGRLGGQGSEIGDGGGRQSPELVG